MEFSKWNPTKRCWAQLNSAVVHLGHIYNKQPLSKLHRKSRPTTSGKFWDDSQLVFPRLHAIELIFRPGCSKWERSCFTFSTRTEFHLSVWTQESKRWLSRDYMPKCTFIWTSDKCAMRVQIFFIHCPRFFLLS